MKKHFYSLFAATAMLLATSCSQEEDFAPSSGEMTTFSVSLNGVTGSRATGDGATATKLYYQAYRGDELVIDKSVDINTTTKIDMSLLKGETYDIIFWAQAPGATFYQIDDLRSITIDYKTAALKANQESYDAFYNALDDFTSDAKTHTIELRRPFAKLNVGTSDWNIVETDAAANENETDPVTHSSVTVKGLANTLNTLTGEATGDEDVTFALSEIPTDFFTLNNVSYKRLSLNYLLVPNSKAPQGLNEYQAEGEDGKANVDLAFALNRGDKQLFAIEVPNAPVQRNWRTNIVGDLLTGSKFDVVIKPETDDNYNTLEILEEVLTKGGEVTLYSNSTLAEDITIPEGVTVKINLNEKTLSLDEVGIKVEGSLILTDGNIDVKGQNSIGLLLWNDNNTTSLDINDVVINVANGAAAIVPYQNGTTEINFRNSKMNVNQGLGGIYGAYWADELKVNLYNSTIEGKNGLYINAKNAEVWIDEKSSASEFNMTGGNLLVTYGGNKPEVKDVNLSSPSVITYKKMDTTAYEGIYAVENGNKEYNVTSAEGVLNLHKLMADITTGEGQGATINLTADVDLENQPFTPIEKMWVTFNGNNHIIKNLNVTGENDWAGRSGFFTYLGGGTISNLTLENVTSTGRQAGIFAGQQEGGKIENCTIAGNNTVVWSATTGIDNVTGNGIGAFVGISVSYSSANEISGTIAEGATVSLQPGTMTPMWDKNNIYYGGLWESTEYTIINPIVNVTDNGSVGYIQSVSNDTELDAAISAMKTTGGTIVLAAGTYSQNIDLTVAKYGAGANENLVFKAAENAEPVIAGTVTLGYRNQGTGSAMWNGNVTFEGITFDHADAEKHSLDVQDVKSLTLKDCKIIGNGETGIKAANGNATGPSNIIGCIFENAGIQGYGNFCTSLVIDDCDFNQSCVNIQGGNSVTVQNCRFDNKLTSAHEGNGFYCIRSNSTPITVKECTIKIDSELTSVATNQAKWYILANRGTTNWTVENVAVTMTEAAMKQTELKVTACTSTGVINHTNLTVNGKVYIAEGVLKNNEGEYEIYKADGLMYFSGAEVDNKVLKLVENIDMNNETFKGMAVGYDKFTFDGNNKTISNIKLTSGKQHGLSPSTGLISVIAGASSNVEVKNLTIENASFADETCYWAGIVMGYIQGTNKLTNVTVNNSKAIGVKKIGGLVGFVEASGTLLAENCSVTNTTVEATEKQAGGLVGYTANTTTLKNCTVSGNNVSSAGTYGDKVGEDPDNKTVVEE